jgi:hypothetical protein
MSKPARISTLRRFVVAFAFVACSVAFGPRPALAWGDEGHEIIALAAERFLDPAVREKIGAMLAADFDDLTAHDLDQRGRLGRSLSGFRPAWVSPALRADVALALRQHRA